MSGDGRDPGSASWGDYMKDNPLARRIKEWQTGLSSKLSFGSGGRDGGGGSVTSGVSSTCAVKGGSGDSTEDGMQSGDSGSQPTTSAGPGTRCGHKPADSVESLEDMRRFGQHTELHRCGLTQSPAQLLQCLYWRSVDGFQPEIECSEAALSKALGPVDCRWPVLACLECCLGTVTLTAMWHGVPYP